MQEQTKPKLFREKSLEAIDSPESLNNYLQVTSPRVWLVLAAVIALLAGLILWGIFGRIQVSRWVAVVSTEEGTACYVTVTSYEEAAKIRSLNRITVDGASYSLAFPDPDEMVLGRLEEFVTDPADLSRVGMISGLSATDLVLLVPVDADLGRGVRLGSLVTETLNPISLLLQ